MADLKPFLCFINGDAGEAAAFYLRVFPGARKLDELVSDGLGPWPKGTVATVTLELLGQEMIFLNQGPPEPLTPAFSWLTDRFGVCWQVTPRRLGEWIRKPKAMEAMMGMTKLDAAVLEAAAREE